MHIVLLSSSYLGLSKQNLTMEGYILVPTSEKPFSAVMNSALFGNIKGVGIVKWVSTLNAQFFPLTLMQWKLL